MSPATAEPGAFTGFPDETFRFLFELTGNNEKAWFEAHRPDYERFYLQPALAFVSAIGPRLQKEVSPDLHYEAKIGGSMFRINRDVRFSNDKSPYKDHLDFWFWQGDRRGWHTPSCYIRLTAESVSVGSGIIHLHGEELAAYRNAVVHPVLGPELEKTVEAVNGVLGLEVGMETRKTVPRGFDKAHPRARFLKQEGVVAMSHASPPPAEVASPEFVDYCIERFVAAQPISEWLLRAL